MSNHIIIITQAEQDLLADKREIDAAPGDTIELVNNAGVAVLIRFCLADSRSVVIECPAELGPLAAAQTHTGLAMPNTSGGELINEIHVIAGDSWPKIMVRRINSTGG